ncbi:MAG: DNA methyltransferase [bacterium]|nr:DNA methyltransferase [bacterium]
MQLEAGTVASLRRALGTTAYTSGSTHNFYHYPARFHPEVAREVISTFSRRGSWILDPFMGGGTSVVEGLALGRRVVGVDINSLAHFVADVRTRPLSEADAEAIRDWAHEAAETLTDSDLSWVERLDARNLPRATELFISGALALAEDMLPRRTEFARAVLLRLGQWALDCRDFQAPRRSQLAERLPMYAEEMLQGMQNLVESCRDSGVAKNQITSRRVLLNRSAVDLHRDDRVAEIRGKPRLVFTSPPYPAVHVLYHRWQYRGRKETDAPYRIANVTDGSGTSYYCGGSRTPTGLRNYFSMIADAFSSVARVMHRDGLVVQIVGFSDIQMQLPRYISAMDDAGFEEVRPNGPGSHRLRRRVANRKWYAKLQGNVDASTELLLLHRLRR